MVESRSEAADWQSASCYLNGEWTPLLEAKVSVLDRGFIFGDGVYEVISVDTIGGIRAPFRANAHFARLQRSLDAIRIENPLRLEQWLDLTAEVIERHAWPRQLVYVQITRGVAKRDHPFPAGIAPTVFVTTSPWPPIPAEQIERGVSAVTHADERWLHCDIKSTSLLGNVLMKQYAIDNGATETVMLRDGFLTEGSSTNVCVIKDGVIAIPPKSVQLLPGITVDGVAEIAQKHGVKVDVRPIAAAELKAADEIMLSSSGRELLAIVSLDGTAVGKGAVFGKPGPMYVQMYKWFQQAKLEDARSWAAQRDAHRGERRATERIA
ncbi:MAG TPA: aminotransferase class IV [Burkholderiaceae bacterium]|nr:aminotransferase class IV [Burkholderiaceae bacterium]